MAAYLKTLLILASLSWLWPLAALAEECLIKAIAIPGGVQVDIEPPQGHRLHLSNPDLEPTFILTKDGDPLLARVLNKPDQLQNIDDQKLLSGKGRWQLEVSGEHDADHEATLTVWYSLCDEKGGLISGPQSQRIPVQALLNNDSQSAASEEVAASSLFSSPASPQTVDAGDLFSSSQTAEPVAVSSENSNDDLKGKGLASFLWAAITAGLLALLTPCVFPMIPITISYFLKHGGESKSRQISLATVYGAGIVVIYCLLGLLIAWLLGGKVVAFATNMWINLLIGAVFLVFAFNLFGAFELQPPIWLMNIAGGQRGSGYLGVLFMGFAFSVVSFTCTAPFVGTILTLAVTEEQTLMPALGMVAFGLPIGVTFTLLAIFPQMLSKLPKAGGWMNAVKVTMGFAELALAFKFLRVVDGRLGWDILTHDAVLSIWIACFFAAGLYLLGFFQLPHDTPVEKVGVGRLLSSLACFAFSVWLMRGLWGVNLGNIDAFIGLDEAKADRGVVQNSHHGNLHWITNEGRDLESVEALIAEAQEIADKEKKLIFIDYTGKY